MEFVYMQSDAIKLTHLRDNQISAKALKTYNFVRKLYKRIKFPAQAEVTQVRKYNKTPIYRSPDEVQIYAYEDARKIVRGYISKDMNLRFVAFSKNFRTRYPLTLADGEIISATFEELREFYKVVAYNATCNYDLYGSPYEGPLFAYEHLERLMQNYKPLKRQELWEHICQVFKRPKHKKTT